MILISNKIKPSYVENTYWADLSENLYGGILKYYNGLTNEWEYIEEPIFQKHPAYNIITEHVLLLDELVDEFGYYHIIKTIQNQLDRLQEDKADIADVYTQEDIDTKLLDINDRISELDISSDTSVKDILAKIEAGDKLNQTQIDLLREESLKHVLKKDGWDLIEISERERLKTLHNYDDTTIKNTLKLTATKTYVDKSIEDLIGGSPQVLDTLKELADALDNDPNFATTITNMIATKADLSYLNNNYYDKEAVNGLLSNFISDVPTVTAIATGVVNSLVPEWSMLNTKPTYTYLEVGAMPADTFIPSKTTDLTNDASFITAQLLQDALDNFEPIPDSMLEKIRFTESYCSYQLDGLTTLVLNSDYYIHELIVSVNHDVSTLLLFSADVPIGRQHIILITSDNDNTFLFQPTTANLLSRAQVSSNYFEINTNPGTTRLDLIRIPKSNRLTDMADYGLITDTDDDLVANDADEVWLLCYHDNSDATEEVETLTLVGNTDSVLLQYIYLDKNKTYVCSTQQQGVEYRPVLYNSLSAINNNVNTKVYIKINGESTSTVTIDLRYLAGGLANESVNNIHVTLDEETYVVDCEAVLELNILTLKDFYKSDCAYVFVCSKLWEISS